VALRLAIAVALCALGLAACGSSDRDRDTPAALTPGSGEDGPLHVHGLGVDPADDALIIATHTGLFRAAAGEQRARRVGDRYQDTMGFTIVGPNRFLGSGHPDARDDLPPLLGLIRSQDGGRSWTPVSLLGRADFHVLRWADGVLYGYDSSNDRLLVSVDDGRRWQGRRVPSPLIDLAVDPSDPSRLVAATEEGLHASADGAARWRRLRGESGLLVWPAPRRLVQVDGDGRVAVSVDGARTWREQGEIGGQPAALAADGGDLYVAVHDGTVKRSRDGGRSWSVRVAP